MNLLRDIIKKIISAFKPDFEKWWWDLQYFKSLNRRPPDLMWQPLTRGPQPQMDSSAVQIDDKLYIFGGFKTMDDVLSEISVLDLKRNRWMEKIPMPSGMGQTHLGLISDGKRYIYGISGQLGTQCHPATANCFVFDSFNKSWEKFPSLPKARYIPVVQLWKGRLHVLSGSQEDRNTPAVDHWSIAVKDGQAIEDKWTTEIPIPRGGPHRASAVVGDALYVFGGQEGDYIAIPGDPQFTCLTSNEFTYPDTYMLEFGSRQWQRMSDMPVKISHAEFTTIILGDKVILSGGMFNKDPQTKVIELTDAIQVYDATADKWILAGRLPYRSKSMVAAYYNGWLYITTGQYEQSPQDSSPGHYDDRLWRVKFSV